MLLGGLQSKANIFPDPSHHFSGAAICPDNSGGQMSGYTTANPNDPDLNAADFPFRSGYVKAAEEVGRKLGKSTRWVEPTPGILTRAEGPALPQAGGAVRARVG